MLFSSSERCVLDFNNSVSLELQLIVYNLSLGPHYCVHEYMCEHKAHEGAQVHMFEKRHMPGEVSLSLLVCRGWSPFYISALHPVRAVPVAMLAI